MSVIGKTENKRKIKKMGNSITNYKKNESLDMSNGSTSVIIELLLLAGSDLAETLWEKEFMVWLAENDQTHRGLGTVGFDVSEIAWTIEHFNIEKKFIIKVTETAINKTNWNKLNYEPHEGIAFDILTRFKNIVQNYELETENLTKWEWYFNPPPNNDFLKCPKHKIFLYYLEGYEDDCCVICNNVAIN